MRLPIVCAVLAVSLGVTATPQARPIAYTDLAPGLPTWLAQQGVAAESFPALLRSINQETGTRLREGEKDHLVYFVLQSSRFTSRPRIEPALSAREFLLQLDPIERERYLTGESASSPGVPIEVRERIQDFLRALARGRSDERIDWFRKSIPPEERTVAHVSTEYRRAMVFLFQKEFVAGSSDISLYQHRGHSSDTRIEANFAVWSALAVLKQRDSNLRMNRVLIVGPGEDFAPRTGLIDSYPPQSYQPSAVADALLALRLADRQALRIDCVDINDRVLEFFEEFLKRREPRLTLVAAWDDPQYLDFFRSLGRHIGTVSLVPGGKSLVVSQDVANHVTAQKLNVITERYDPSPRYDLVVATNVFIYFDKIELSLALSNIHSMLGTGGTLIHNEPRPEVEEVTRLLGFPPVEARTLQLSEGQGRPLFDSFVIHRKNR
jgi:hypothetical protein